MRQPMLGNQSSWSEKGIQRFSQVFLPVSLHFYQRRSSVSFGGENLTQIFDKSITALRTWWIIEKGWICTQLTELVSLDHLCLFVITATWCRNFNGATSNREKESEWIENRTQLVIVNAFISLSHMLKKRNRGATTTFFFFQTNIPSQRLSEKFPSDLFEKPAAAQISWRYQKCSSSSAPSQTAGEEPLLDSNIRGPFFFFKHLE